MELIRNLSDVCWIQTAPEGFGWPIFSSGDGDTMIDGQILPCR